MTLRVRLTNGGEDLFEDRMWSQVESEEHWTPTFTYRVRHEYVVDGDALRITKATTRQRNDGPIKAWSSDEVAFYRSAQWETVRRD